MKKYIYSIGALRDSGTVGARIVCLRVNAPLGALAYVSTEGIDDVAQPIFKLKKKSDSPRNHIAYGKRLIVRGWLIARLAGCTVRIPPDTVNVAGA